MFFYTIRLFSLPFLSTSTKPILNDQRRASVDRRYTSPSFRNVPPKAPSDGTTNNEHAWKSLSHLSSAYLHSIATIQNNVLYKGSIHHKSLPNKLDDNDHRNDKTAQPMVTSDDMCLGTITNQSEKQATSLISQFIAQINLKLLRNNAFALFTFSNFLSSLGFFVPYNFAHDLAKDSHVEESHRKFVIMAIGFSTCFGHIIIGYLADRQWV